MHRSTFVQEHNSLSRGGLYIDSAFTSTNAAGLTRDLGFDGTISGNVYAQPLYIEGGPDGRSKLIVVTESNNVYALDAFTGGIIWQRNVGAPVTSGLSCGNVSPLGITGTPAVDLGLRSLFFDAMTDGAYKKHFIYSLNLDTGATNARVASGRECRSYLQRFHLHVIDPEPARCPRGGEWHSVCAVFQPLRRLRHISRVGCRRRNQ